MTQPQRKRSRRKIEGSKKGTDTFNDFFYLLVWLHNYHIHTLIYIQFCCCSSVSRARSTTQSSTRYNNLITMMTTMKSTSLITTTNLNSRSNNMNKTNKVGAASQLVTTARKEAIDSFKNRSTPTTRRVTRELPPLLRNKNG